MQTREVFTAQVQEKTFPSWLRNRGLRVLWGEFVPGFNGPEFKGWVCLHAFSVHVGATYDSPGYTLWFLGPDDDTENPFSIERWNEASDYILQRIGRRAHTPKAGFTSYLFPAASPGVN